MVLMPMGRTACRCKHFKGEKIFKSVECPLTCNHLPTPIQISKLFHAKRDGVGWEIGALGWDGGMGG